MNILEAMDDPKVFGESFRDGSTWTTWRTFLAAIFGLPMTREQRLVFKRCTDRKMPPVDGVTEAWLVCGRRSGKSFILAVIAVFLATFRDWRPYLAPGERATVMVLAADKKQARVILGYVKGLIKNVEMLAATVQGETADAVQLRNRVSIEVHTANYRSVRGYTIVAALCDEIAFWRSDDSANPDSEILAALRPAMATVPGAFLLCASSPYARRGALWKAHRRHYGKDSPVMVWQAPTLIMNPTVPQRVIDEAYEDDPASAAAEYGAEFRKDVESFIAQEVVEAAVPVEVRERPPLDGVKYHGFVDPSGGSQDSFTLAIAHAEEDIAMLDCVREVKAPFSPEAVVAEFAAVLKSYRVREVQGDRYAGEWPREQFRKRGIEYRSSKAPKSDLYRELLPLLNSGTAELLDHDRLAHQLVGLERRSARGGRDSIDHPPGAMDDLANAVAGALVRAVERKRTREPLIPVGPEIITVYD